MRKADVLGEICNRLGIKGDKKVVKEILDSYVSIIKDEVLAGNNFNIPGFGTFQVVERAKKVTNSLFTDGKDVVIPQRKAVRFKVSNLFKQNLVQEVKIKKEK